MAAGPQAIVGSERGLFHATWRRTRLVSRVLDVIDTGPSHVVIQAPTGYGKSVLLHGIAAEVGNQNRVIHVELKACEGDISLFVDGLVAAIRRSCPRANLRPLLMVKKAGVDGELGERLAYALVSTLGGLSSGAVGVLLDDVHILKREPQLAELVIAVVRETMRRISWVLASRTSTDWLLEASGLQSSLDLRAMDLAYQAEEAAAWLPMGCEFDTAEPVFRRLMAQTAGWPLALELFSQETVGPLDPSVWSAAASRLVSLVSASVSDEALYVLKVLSVYESVELDEAVELLSGSPLHAVAGVAKSRFIALPEEVARAQFLHLTASQLLSEKGRGFEMVPVLRQSLQARFKREDPRAFREAHRRAANLRLRLSHEHDDVIENLLQAECWEQLLEELESRVDRLFRARHLDQLTRWLLALEAQLTALPPWALHATAILNIHSGRWSEARAMLERCNKVLVQLNDPEQAAAWRPRLYLAHARLSHERGSDSEAVTFCKRGLDYIRQRRGQDLMSTEVTQGHERTALELSNLLAQLHLDLGAYAQASTMAHQALELAKRRSCDLGYSLATRLLASVAGARGEPEQAVTMLMQARELASTASDAVLVEQCGLEFGLLLCRVGQMAAGVQAAQTHLNGLVLRDEAQLALRGHGLLGLALLDAGQADDARALFEAGDVLATAVSSPKVAAVFFECYAIFCARVESMGRTKRATTKASLHRSKLKRPDLELIMLRAQAKAESAAREGRYEAATRAMEGALENAARVGSTYHVMRMSWRVAYWAHLAFLNQEFDSPDLSSELAERSAELANRSGYRLPFSDVDAEFLNVGFALGGPALRGVCEELLSAMTLDDMTVDDWGASALSAETLGRYRSYRQAEELTADFIITTRDQQRGANAREVATLIKDVRPEQLVLMVPDQEMYLGGARVSLQEKRVILPLLLYFLKQPERAFTMEELTCAVWGAQEGAAKMKTKVKVAISRLRGLLDAYASYIMTVKVPQPVGKPLAGYQLHESADFVVVECSEDDAL